MSKFETEKMIHSCHVNIDLITKLENYILNNVLNITNTNIKEIDFELLLIDKYSSEKINSIEEYPHSMFPEGIREIRLNLNATRPSPLDIEIRFNKDRFFSRIKITYVGDNSRELVAGFYNEITRIIQNHENANWVFHPHSFLSMISIIIPFVCSIVILLIRNFQELSVRASLLIFIVYIYYCLARVVKPFTTFQTSSFEKQTKYFNWLTSGLLGVIIFDIIFHNAFVWLFNL